MAKYSRIFLLLVTGAGLSSCGMSAEDTFSTIAVAPPSIEYRTCDQLIAAIRGSITAQKRLQDLEKKAGGGPGAVIGATTYRPQYLTQRGSEINMRRSAREKGCQMPADLPPLNRG